MEITLESIRAHCLKREGRISESFPFNEYALVFKVDGKMFALVSTDSHPLTVNLKCDPGYALELRDRYPAVIPGYHMNKKHWNTVSLDGSIPAREIFDMIDHSHALVAKPPKKSIRTKSPKEKNKPHSR